MKMRKEYLLLFLNKEDYYKPEKGWVIKKVKLPTRNKGSQTIWSKDFSNYKEAYDFYQKKKKLSKVI